MSEGLLYKKIREHGNYDSQAGYWDSLSGEFVEEVLDEAKQDFENIVDSNYRGNTSEEYYSFWNELANLVKKWFGNAEEKEG